MTKENKSNNQPYREGNVWNVPRNVNGKTRWEKIMTYPMTEEHIQTLEAVKCGLFTVHEMKGVIDCYHDDLQMVFMGLNVFAKTSKERVERLLKDKNHFLVRWDMLSHIEKAPYVHQHLKLMNFLDKRIQEEEQKIYFEQSNSGKYKPLLLKEMAQKYGCSGKHISNQIKALTNEGKFTKSGKGRFYSTLDLKLLEILLECSFAYKD